MPYCPSLHSILKVQSSLGLKPNQGPCCSNTRATTPPPFSIPQISPVICLVASVFCLFFWEGTNLCCSGDRGCIRWGRGSHRAFSAPLFFNLRCVCVLETCFYGSHSPLCLCSDALWADRRLCCPGARLPLLRCVVVTVLRQSSSDICSAFLQCVEDKDTVASSYIKENMDLPGFVASQCRVC